MLIKVDDVSGVKKVLHIEIPKEDIKDELNKTYTEIKKTARIKGFRKGHAPRSIIESVYGKEAKSDVLGKLMETSFQQAIDESKLYVIGMPEIKRDEELKEDSSYKYEAVVEIKPDIANVNISGFKLKKKIYKVEEENIEKQLEAVQKRNVEYKPVEKEEGVQKGDFAAIDFEIFKEGNHLEDKDVKNARLKVGENMIIEALDENLIGMKPNDMKDIVATFSEDYPDKDLAGAEVSFKVKLNSIEKEELPEINDDFAKKMGQFKTLDELKDFIRKNLEEGFEKRSEQDLHEQIFMALLEQVNFEIPNILLEKQKEMLSYEAERYLDYHGLSEEEISKRKEALRQIFHETAEKEVRRYLMLNKVIEQEDFKLTDEEVNVGYEEVSKSINQPVETIKNYYETNKSSLEDFKMSLLSKKALKIIIEKSEIEEVSGDISESAEQKEEDVKNNENI